MTNIRCRKCGAKLEPDEASGAAVCGSCGFRQAMPMTETEEALEKYEEAAQRLAAGEYEKAAEIYGALAAEYPEDPEALWGTLLCSREVEYSVEPISGERKPFCRSMEAESILTDPLFDRVLELADEERRTAYQTEAALIEEAFHSAGAKAETEELGRGIRALERREWKRAESLFLRVLNGNRKSSESYLGLMLTRNRMTTLNEFLRSILNSLPPAETTTESIPVNRARVDEAVAKYAVPGYLKEDELLPLFDYPLTYESRVKGCSETQQKASQTIEENELLGKALRYASGNYKTHLETTIQSFRDSLLEATAAAERDAKTEAEKLESAYTQHLNEAEKQASERSAAARDRQENDYRALCKRQRQAKTPEELAELAEAFAAMNGYKESDNRVIVCRKRMEKGPAEKKLRVELVKKLRIDKKKLIYGASAVGAAVVILAAVLLLRPVTRYNAAKKLYETGAYAEALEAFTAQSGYRDSDDWAMRCVEMMNRPASDPLPPEDTGSAGAPENTPSAEPTQEPENTPPVQEQTGDLADDTGADAGDAQEELPPADAVFVNGAYLLSAPADWAEKVDVLPAGYSISFYEKANRDGAGGLLFALNVLSRDEMLDYVDIPESQFLGCLTKGGEELFLMLRRPSDMQYGEGELAEAYQAAEEPTDGIIASLESTDGYSFTPAEQVQMASEQVLVADCSGNSAQLSLRCWTGNGWTEALYIPASIGTYGVTEKKMDGDYSTPAGTFNLLFCMALEQPDTKLDFRRIESDDYWVCDPDSEDYNTLRKLGSGVWASAESMYNHFAYGISEACICFDFNGDGETAGSATRLGGSALFIDGVGPYGKMTTGYGDIKISGEDMQALLRVLDSEKNPTITIRSAN